MVRVRSLNPSRIYRARLKADLTQEELAYRLRDAGVKASGRYINRWENGHNAPRAEVLPVLAEILGVSIGELYEPTADDEEDRALAIRQIRAELVLAGRDDLAEDLRRLTGAKA